MSTPKGVRNVGRFRIYRAATMDAALRLVEDGREVVHIRDGHDYRGDSWCEVVTDARKTR